MTSFSCQPNRLIAMTDSDSAFDSAHTDSSSACSTSNENDKCEIHALPAVEELHQDAVAKPKRWRRIRRSKRARAQKRDEIANRVNSTLNGPGAMDSFAVATMIYSAGAGHPSLPPRRRICGFTHCFLWFSFLACLVGPIMIFVYAIGQVKEGEAELVAAAAVNMLLCSGVSASFLVRKHCACARASNSHPHSSSRSYRGSFGGSGLSLTVGDFGGDDDDDSGGGS